MASGSAKTTKGGNLMKPDIVLACNWVKQEWSDTPSKMIQRSFLKCCKCNSMDGSEDDAVYKDDDDTETADTDDDNDVYDDIQYTEDDFEQLFHVSDDGENDF